MATAVLNARANDGSDNMMTFTLGNAPGQYQVDPLHPNQKVLSPNWGKVTPFGVNNIANFNEPPPPALNSQAYTDAYNEVLNYGGDGTDTPTLRTPEETEIGIFWAYDGTVGMGTPPRFYNQIIASDFSAARQHRVPECSTLCDGQRSHGRRRNCLVGCEI